MDLSDDDVQQFAEADRRAVHHDELSLSLGWFSVEVPGASQGRWRPQWT
jgi:hypothetical protein